MPQYCKKASGLSHANTAQREGSLVEMGMMGPKNNKSIWKWAS